MKKKKHFNKNTTQNLISKDFIFYFQLRKCKIISLFVYINKRVYNSFSYIEERLVVLYTSTLWYVTNSLFEAYIKAKMYFRNKISSAQRKFARMYEIIDFICACLS